MPASGKADDFKHAVSTTIRCEKTLSIFIHLLVATMSGHPAPSSSMLALALRSRLELESPTSHHPSLPRRGRQHRPTLCRSLPAVRSRAAPPSLKHPLSRLPPQSLLAVLLVLVQLMPPPLLSLLVPLGALPPRQSERGRSTRILCLPPELLTTKTFRRCRCLPRVERERRPKDKGGGLLRPALTRHVSTFWLHSTHQRWGNVEWESVVVGAEDAYC